MDLLGNTLGKIAFEKAGIIKQHKPVIVSERQAEVEKVFIAKAMENESSLSFASDHITLKQKNDGVDVYSDEVLWLKDLDPGLKGHYQIMNIPGVLEGVLRLREIGFEISDNSVREGISKVVALTGLKGRWQKLRDLPLTIADTAHNPAGIKEVITQLNSTPHDHLHFVFGAVKEKNLTEVLQLMPKDATYYFCEAKIPRALDATLLAREASAFGLKGEVIKDVNEAYRTATKNADDGDLVFIGGSTFVVGEIEGL